VVTPNKIIREHLEDSILLAYLRRQQLDDSLRLRISQHIDIEQCPRCRHKLNELSQVSTTLTVLGRMQSYQHYPEISVADTYVRVKSAANKRTALQAYLYRINNRQRPRKSAVRLVSLPVAFGLAILLTVAMLVFANLSGRPWISGSSPGGTSTSQNISTALPPHHSTPSPDLALTTTVSTRESTATPTATPVTGPYIEVCSTPNHIAHWRLVICGHNFEAGYKAILFASRKPFILLFNQPVQVDQQGNFQVGWNIVNCWNLPTTISAYERVNTKLIFARLQNIAFGSCPPPTPTVGPPGV
jgi:hypothetical protein